MIPVDDIPLTTQNGQSDQPQTHANPKAKGKPLPVGMIVSPRMRLNSINDCKREIRKLYADARNGRIATSEASRLTFILTTLANLIVDSDIEADVAALNKVKHRR